MGFDFQQELQASQLPDIAEGADVLVGSGLLFFGPSAAELHGIAYRHLCHVPTSVRSDRHAPYVFRYAKRPRPVNRLLWAVNGVATRAFTIPLLDRGRAAIGLPPISDYGRYFSGRVILAADKALCPQEGRGDPGVFRTGYWLAEPGRGLPDALLDFLESGPRPIYVGFGSMADHRADTMEAELGELVRSGSRLVLGCDLASYADRFDPKAVFPARDVEHQLLFPRVAAAVHHGGAGTTYTAALSGVPQVIVPHIMDQFYWASRVEDLGIGRALSPRHRTKLAGLALEAAADADLARRAREFSTRVENGPSLEEAARLVEKAAIESGGAS